jgi:allophanate hydrolase
MPVAHYGSFVALIGAPLGIGTLRLEDGGNVQGFLCEALDTLGQPDITAFGGWRAYLSSQAAHRSPSPGPSPV